MKGEKSIKIKLRRRRVLTFQRHQVWPIEERTMSIYVNWQSKEQRGGSFSLFFPSFTGSVSFLVKPVFQIFTHCLHFSLHIYFNLKIIFCFPTKTLSPFPLFLLFFFQRRWKGWPWRTSSASYVIWTLTLKSMKISTAAHSPVALSPSSLLLLFSSFSSPNSVSPLSLFFPQNYWNARSLMKWLSIGRSLLSRLMKIVLLL